MATDDEWVSRALYILFFHSSETGSTVPTDSCFDNVIVSVLCARNNEYTHAVLVLHHY